MIIGKSVVDVYHVSMGWESISGVKISLIAQNELHC